MPSIDVQSVTKADREKFGLTGQPIPATKCFKAPFSNFSRPDVRAEKWIIENSQTGTVVFANTYDDKLGSHFNLESATRSLNNINTKRQAKRMREYREVPVEQCPIAVPQQ